MKKDLIKKKNHYNIEKDHLKKNKKKIRLKKQNPPRLKFFLNTLNKLILIKRRN
jgi:hypothetical protein